MSGYVLKAPDADREVCVDWCRGYLDGGEGVEDDLGWTLEPLGSPDELSVVSQTVGGTVSSARLAGGLPGKVYLLVARARTTLGRRLERAVVLRIAV